MSAPRRTARPKTLWHLTGPTGAPEKSFQTDVLSYLEAADALAKITGPALKKELVWRILWDLAFRFGGRNVKNGRWYSLPDFPLETLRRFPNKVRGWAEQIEKLGKAMRANEAYSFRNPFTLALELEADHKGKIGPAASLVNERITQNLLGSRAELLKLDQLPSLLLLYADYIEAVHKLTGELAPKAATRYKAGAIYALIDCVRRVTGKPHFEDIATLLTAAYAACGSNEVVSAANLKTQYSRHSTQK